LSLIEINKNPSRRDLFWFGAVVAALCGVIGAIFHWKLGAPSAARGFWIAGAAILVVYYAVPPLRRPMYVGWMVLCWPLGWVMSHVILGIAYFLVITPVGLIMRAFGNDPMRRKFDRSATTYWTPHEERAGGSFSQF
jgi:hypothetical protein